MRIALLLVFTLLLCKQNPCSAQSAADWTIYLDVTTINGQLELENTVLLATDGGVAVYDKQTEQIVDRWTRASHGLPSNMIEAIVRDPANQQLIIGTYDLGMFRGSGDAEDSWEAISVAAFSDDDDDQFLTYCLAYDDQGRLMAGTSEGLLIRESEEEWTVYGPNQSGSFFHEAWEMLTLPDGTVYVAGNVLLRVADGEIGLHAPVGFDTEHSDSLTIAYADRKLLLAPNGDLWSLSDANQIARYTAGGAWELYGFNLNSPDLIFSLFYNSFLDLDGVLHLQSFNGAYIRFDGTAFVPAQLPVTLAELDDIQLLNGQLAGRRSDSLYLITEETSAQWLGKLGNWPWANDRISDLFTDEEGNSWASMTNNRIINLTTNEIVPLPDNPNGNTGYSNFAFDGEDLWMLSAEGFQLWENRQELIVYPYTDTTEATYIHEGFVSDTGVPWFYNDLREVYSLENGAWTRQATIPEGYAIISFLPFSDNRVLIETYNPAAPSEFRLVGNGGIVEPFTFPAELGVLPAWTPLAGENAGSIWFYTGDDRRLIKYEDGEEIIYLDLPAAWPGQELIRSFQELDNKLVFALSDHVGLYNGTNWEVYNFANAPLETTNIESANLDASGVLRINHGFFKRALEELQTDITSDLGEVGRKESVRETLIVAPNPASEWITVQSDAGLPYFMFNTTGQTVMRGLTTPDRTRIDVAGLRPGIYYLMAGNRSAKVTIVRP